MEKDWGGISGGIKENIFFDIPVTGADGKTLNVKGNITVLKEDDHVVTRIYARNYIFSNLTFLGGQWTIYNNNNGVNWTAPTVIGQTNLLFFILSSIYFMYKFFFSTLILACFLLSTKAQSSKLALGVFSDIMLEAPVYPVYYGVQGSYDLSNHQMLQASVGYSNVHMTTVGADYLYRIKDAERSNLNIYAGAGISGDFYKKKIEIQSEDFSAQGYAKKNYFALNPTVGLSYRFNANRTSVNAGYKLKYYPFENAADINFLSLGLRYHLK